MRLALHNYIDVQEYLKRKKSIIIPIGSTEQHSPVGLIGTDHLIAESIAYEVGNKTNTYVAPTISYGMSNHHMAFPGTISLNPTTLICVVKDVLMSLYAHGFSKFYFLNGHGGNISSVDSAFSEITRDIDITCKIISWWTHPEISELKQKLFGTSDGHHATPTEISITIFLYKELFSKEMKRFNVEHPKYNWPLSPRDFKNYFPDGRMESDPSLANYEHGKLIFNRSVEVITNDLVSFDNN
ncbi:MAG: creatininase family protein [Spirochaetota bacterium]|nr:creatininase family protein [Spirochaetota bacterium]